MAIPPEIHFADPDELFLDPRNPRLGRRDISKNLSQADLLKRMADWTLDELAVSFIESGFFVQEPLIVVEEPLYKIKSKVKVVVEGNRRLAALKLLWNEWNGNSSGRRWADIAATAGPSAKKKLERIPYQLADRRVDVQAYLGFRHVTGIKQWEPAEKAQFVAHLVDEEEMSFVEIARRIGSKTPTVRRQYEAFRALLQLEEMEGVDPGPIEERFSALYRLVGKPEVRGYLGMGPEDADKASKTPIPKKSAAHARSFAKWVFGSADTSPVLVDTREVERFGKLLASEASVHYLESATRPSFETAYRIAGGDVSETAEQLENASYGVQNALQVIHHHTKVGRIRSAVQTLARDVIAMLAHFPDIRKELLEAAR